MKSWKLTELKFIKDNLHLTDAELAKHFNVPTTTILGTRKRHKIFRPNGRFKKGKAPWNKGISYHAGGNSSTTQFKKGSPPPTAFRNIGDVFQIPDATGKVYSFIKLAHHRQYSYGRYVWEQHNKEQLTKDDMIRFKDGNTQNFSIDNLVKVTRKENALKNANREKAAKSLRMKKIKLLKELVNMGFSVKDFIINAA